MVMINCRRALFCGSKRSKGPELTVQSDPVFTFLVLDSAFPIVPGLFDFVLIRGFAMAVKCVEMQQNCFWSDICCRYLGDFCHVVTRVIVFDIMPYNVYMCVFKITIQAIYQCVRKALPYDLIWLKYSTLYVRQQSCSTRFLTYEG